MIAAAGSGARLGAGGPKAFVEIAGRPMIEWSLEAIRAATSVEAIVIALPPGAKFESEGVVMVEGGPSRSESVALALEAVSTDLVVVHDAARPLVSAELIDAVVAAVAEDGPDCVVAATRVTDTIKEARRGGLVDRTLDRSALWAVQTPQAFKTASLREGLASTSLLAQATDDAMLVERIGGEVRVHEAPPENIKVTTALDLLLAEMLLTRRG